MRIAIGKLLHETNTMSSQRVTWDDFASHGLVTGDDILPAYADVNDCVSGFLTVAEREDMEVVPTIAAGATPGGRVTADAYRELKDELVGRIEAAGALDGVLLDLHGAMAVEGMVEGAEGDIAAEVRDVVGPDVPVVSTADPHGNISQRYVDSVDALFAYNTIPHTDMAERGVEAAETLVAIVEGSIEPTMVREKLPMMVPSGKQLVGYENATGPLPEVLAEAFRWEEREGVINVNVFVGFDRSDVPDVGACIVAVTDDDTELGEDATAAVAERLWNRRKRFLMETMDPAEAIRRAAEIDGRPVVLADMEDAPSGGGTGDGTEVLRTMIASGVESAAIWMADAETVATAIDAGIGSTVTLAVGGKKSWRADGKHAEPVEVTGDVRHLSDGDWTIKGPSGTGTTVHMGRTAVVEVDGIDVVASENRIDPKDPELFRSVGIEPTDRDLVVIKSKHHWRAAWEPIIAATLVVRCPTDHSLSTIGVPRWEYENVPRPIWPLDEGTEYDATP